MDTSNEKFYQVLLIICAISAVGMVVLGFGMSNSIYIDVCGMVCAGSGFFLLGSPEISRIDERLKYFRFATIAWILYSAYRIYTKL